MRIAIFGGTGSLGTQCVQQALEEGHSVQVLARTPQKVTLIHDALSVVKGDVLMAEDVLNTLKDQDAVLCCLGGSGLGDTSTRSAGTKIILETMKTLGIQKIVVCSSLGASGSHHHLSFVGRLFIKSVLRKPMIDHTAQEEALRESDREWVVVRPPRLIDGKRTEKYRLAEEEETFNARQISLSDVAHFMLRSLQETTWNQKSISISD